MNWQQALFVGFCGAIVGVLSTKFFVWRQEIRLARHKFACALFKLDHELNPHHRKPGDIYATFTEPMVFEIYDLGMAYVMVLPPWVRGKQRTKIGYLLGLMDVIEGDVRHSVAARSLPSFENAIRYTDELILLLGYKSR
jgi:hypothetical protein